MAAPIEIDFVSLGIAQVLRAFDALDAKAEQIERSVSGHARTQSRARETGTKREVDVRQKEYEKLLRQLEADEKAATKAAEKEAAARTKAGEAAAKEGTRAAERESRSRQKIAVDEARAEERVFAQSLRERERAAKAATRIAETAAAERVRIAEREASQSAAASRRSSRAVGHSMVSAGVGSIGRTVGGAASLLGGALTVGGGFEVAGALRGELTFERAVAQTSNAAYVEGDPTRTRAAADPAKIAALATQVQSSTNISKLDAVNALHKYVNLASDLTGMTEVNKETGRTNLEELARLSKGSGANFEDLMTSAGYLKAQNPNLSSADLNLHLRQMVGAGAKGDISIAEMAQVSATATANAGQFAGDLGVNQARMLGLTQIAGRVSDPAEAAEAVNKLAFDVSKHATKMQAAGIAVTDKAGKILDPATLIGNLFEKTGGNIGKLSDVGIEARSARVFEGLQRNYDEAEAVKKGTGAAAVRREVADYETISFSQQSADENFANAMNTSAEKVTKALNDLDESVARAAKPAFDDFVKMMSEHKGDIESIVSGLGKLATAFAEHPIASILTAIAANVGKDVAAAGIGKVLATKIEALLTRVGGEGALPGVAGGGAGLPGGAGLGLGIASVVGGVVSAAAAGVVIGEGANAWVDQVEGDRAKALGADDLKTDIGKRDQNIERLKAIIADEDSSDSATARAMGAKAREEDARAADVKQLKALGIDFDPLKDAVKELTKTIQTHGKTLTQGQDVLIRPSRSGPIPVPNR